MNRRGFLRALGIGATVLALDPEKALWTPGKKLISIPKPAPLTQQQVYDLVAQRILDATWRMSGDFWKNALVEGTGYIRATPDALIVGGPSGDRLMFDQHLQFVTYGGSSCPNF